MKRVFWTVLILFLVQPVMGVTLTGGVVYTVESARKAAFDGIEYEISMEPYRGYMVDPGFIAAGGEGKRPKVRNRGRNITWFSDGTYGVSYYDNPEYFYSYTSIGQLEYIEIKKNKYSYPNLSKKYNLNGKLTRVFYNVGSNNSFVYFPDKQLEGQWRGNKFYNEKGKIIGTRK